jgi:hypothetical protein
VACAATRGPVLTAVDEDAGAPNDATAPAAPAIALSAGTTTAAYGGTGGSPYTDTCPGDEAVIGFQGYLYIPEVGLGPFVGVIQAMCGALGVAGPPYHLTTTPTAALPERGLSYDSAWSAMCPADQVVVGFVGRSGIALDQVAFTCAPFDVALAGTSGSLTEGPTTTTAANGGTGGSPFTDGCPAGQIARGTALRSGQWVDALALVCGVPAVVAGGAE